MKLILNATKIHDAFDDFNAAVQEQLSAFTGPVYTINHNKLLMSLYSIYLNSFNDTRKIAGMTAKQEHTCRCCTDFISKYGGMYTVNADGVYTTIWGGHVPKKYRTAAQQMQSAVLEAASRDDDLIELPNRIGHADTGQFSHFFMTTPYQQDAKKVVHYREANERLRYAAANGMTPSTLENVLEIVKLMGMSRQEKVLPILQFMLNWHAANRFERRNLVASAHDGLTHPRGTLLQTLIENMKAGDSPATMKAKFERLIDPLAYQRPTEAPKDGALQRAETLFKTMGLEKSLARRGLMRQEIPNAAKIWVPSAYKRKDVSPAVFAHIGSAPAFTASAPESYTEQTLTWVRFKEAVMPFAAQIEVYGKSVVPCTLTTAVHSEAPPLLAHDKSPRNPASWWVLHGRTMSTPDLWNTVECITKDVTKWFTAEAGMFDVLVFTTQAFKLPPYSGLFPELLRHELREVRSVIEKHNTSGVGVQSPRDQDAVGVRMGPSARAIRIRVTLKSGATAVYNIDRYQ